MQGADFPIKGSWVQNHCLAPRSTKSFVPPKLVKWVPGTLGDLVIKSKLSPSNGSASLRQLNLIHKKGPLFMILEFTLGLLEKNLPNPIPDFCICLGIYIYNIIMFHISICFTYLNMVWFMVRETSDIQEFIAHGNCSNIDDIFVSVKSYMRDRENLSIWRENFLTKLNW